MMHDCIVMNLRTSGDLGIQFAHQSEESDESGVVELRINWRSHAQPVLGRDAPVLIFVQHWEHCLTSPTVQLLHVCLKVAGP